MASRGNEWRYATWENIHNRRLEDKLADSVSKLLKGFFLAYLQLYRCFMSANAN